jgi:hypothetical protein
MRVQHLQGLGDRFVVSGLMGQGGIPFMQARGDPLVMLKPLLQLCVLPITADYVVIFVSSHVTSDNGTGI